MKVLLLFVPLFFNSSIPTPAVAVGTLGVSTVNVTRVEIPDDAVDATFVRAQVDYHNLIGDFESTIAPGTTIELLRPIGSGVHVLEIGWMGAAGAPQLIPIPNSGQFYLTETALFVDFQSTDHTIFAASDSTDMTCDGTYTNVLSVVASGTCWGPRSGSGGTETRKCNNVSAGGNCSATITYTTTPPEPVHPTFECGGGGTIDFNTTTHIAHANKANDGTC